MEKAPLNKVTSSDALTAAKLMAQEDGKLIDTVHHRTVTKEDREKMYDDVLKLVNKIE